MFRPCFPMFLVIVGCISSFLAAVQPAAASEISKMCSVTQGFFYAPDDQSTVGHLLSMTIGGTALTADVTVTDPCNSGTTRSAVGVMSEIYWGGGYADPIMVWVQVSTANKNRIAVLLHTSLPSTEVRFTFVVDEYDPVAKRYYHSFHCGETTLYGLIHKTGGVLSMSVSNEAGMEVVSPQNYAFFIAVMPRDILQTLTVAISSMASIEKTWGVSAVPVELTGLHAEYRAPDVEVRWRTATEVNNYGFEIQRSEIRDQKQDAAHTDRGILTPDQEWKPVAFVEGAGTSNSPNEYSFFDKIPKTGKYSYRLKHIDRDGKFGYSPEVEVVADNLPNIFALEQNYPNPFNPTTKIGFRLPVSGFVSLKIYDMVGRELRTLLNEVKEAGEYNVSFSTGDGIVARYPSGIYFYTLHTGNYSATKRMILLK